MSGQEVAIASCDSYRLEAVESAIDKLCASLGMPKANPFSEIVSPGMTVFIKPNWVASRWRASLDHVDDLYCVITHPAIIEAVTDRVARALDGTGRIIIADSPSIDADFNELMRHTGIGRLQNKYDVPVDIFDLRPLVCTSLDVYGQRDKMKARPGDPNGEVEVNLGTNSLLYGVDPSLFHGVFDQRDKTIASHTGATQLYTFSRSFFDSDVFISIPKMKTHMKVGATLNLKGLVGTVTNKDQLVHWRVGYPEVGGDEYEDRAHWEEGQKAKVTHRGAWPGNDTIWRMVVDLYQCAMGKTGGRRCFSIVDGIMAGEGAGPFGVTAKYADCLIAGRDLLAVDMVAARYMGIDPAKVRYLEYFMEELDFDPKTNISVFVDGILDGSFFDSDKTYKNFYLVDNWRNIRVG